MSPFSKTIRDLRVKRHLLQKDAALMLGYEQSYLSALETGAKGPPRKDFIERLIKMYALDQEEICELEHALTSSKRILVLPKGASQDEFQLFSRLSHQLGRLKKQQIDLITIALEIGDCP